MGKRRRSVWKLPFDAAEIDWLARELVDAHASLLQRGYRLCRSSGIWRRRNGSVTARIVYKRDDCTIDYCLRGISLGAGP